MQRQQILQRHQIRVLIPHAGAMCLLDRVIEWNENRICCASESHHSGQMHPLWRDNGIASVHLIEYGAQAAAVHAGLIADESGQQSRGGVLAGLREVTLTAQRIDTLTTPLDIQAEREMGGPQGMIYRFLIASAGVTQCSGRLTIMTTT